MKTIQKFGLYELKWRLYKQPLTKGKLHKKKIGKKKELSAPPCPQVCRNTYPNIWEK
jgi:hypothetical protein